MEYTQSHNKMLDNMTFSSKNIFEPINDDGISVSSAYNSDYDNAMVNYTNEIAMYNHTIESPITEENTSNEDIDSSSTTKELHSESILNITSFHAQNNTFYPYLKGDNHTVDINITLY